MIATASTITRRRRSARRVSGIFEEIIVDSFAGGGGASVGIEKALGRSVDVAINHDDAAIAMHEANHPLTAHRRADIWTIDPHEATGDRPVGLMWASPDCRHFSRAKGSKPVSPRVRGLAWVVVKWAEAVRPRVIILENVAEFETWGPLVGDRPCPERRGQTFLRWVRMLERLGYEVERRILDAADYGAPTHRRRLFIVARCDGRPIVWPEPTHGPGRSRPWRSAAECIDWSLPCHSIFLTREEARPLGIVRPLAENTMRRIARGVWRYVIEAQEPFIVRCGHSGDEFRGQSVRDPLGTVTGKNNKALVIPFLAQHYTGMTGKPLSAPLPCVTAIDHTALVAASIAQIGQTGGGGKYCSGAGEPLSTICTKQQHLLVTSFLSKFYGDSKGWTPAGADLRKPMPVVCSGAYHLAEVRAFLVKYYGQGCGQRVNDPLGTATTRDRFGLVTVDGVDHQIIDIGMRMLSPRELARAQGFPDSYILTGTKSSQTARIGNSVCPPVAEAMVRANCGDLAS